MSTYRKEWILGILFLVVVILHVDFWWWGVREPFLFGVLPFTMWWALIIDVICLAVFLWWNQWGWPSPPEDFEHELRAKEELFK